MFSRRAFPARTTIRPLLRRVGGRLSNLLAPALAARSFSRSVIAKSDDHESDEVEEIYVGPGSPPGAMPTDYDQSTGVERLEYLARLQGFDWWASKDKHPGYYGTRKKPIYVKSQLTERIVGCTGFPLESHPLMWFRVWETKENDEPWRCPECGCAFELIPRVPQWHMDDPDYGIPKENEEEEK